MTVLAIWAALVVLYFTRSLWGSAFHNAIPCPLCFHPSKVMYLGLDIGDCQHYSRYCPSPDCNFEIRVEVACDGNHTNPIYLPAFFEKVESSPVDALGNKIVKHIGSELP